MSFNSALLLLSVAAHAVILVEGSMDCGSYSYRYTLQPPEAIVCSPYINDVLNLTCAVSGDLVDDIQWFFRHNESSQAVVLSNNSQVAITPSEFEGDYSATLTILHLNPENEGFYWCQGLIQHDNHTLELSQSDQFELLPEQQYFPFRCPRNKAHKSSTVRCAAIIPRPVPSTSQALPGLTSTMERILPVDRSSTTGQIYPTTTSPSPTISQFTTTAVAVSPTSQPSSTDSTFTGTADQSPTGTHTGSTTLPPLDQGTVQLSDIILYAILGLLGCLVVLVFSLSIVISVLCCKKRHRNLEGKDAPYDQFSTESEAPPGTLTLKSLDSYPLPPPPPPYRLPQRPSHSDTMTSSSSGVYDEIHTIMSQYGAQQPCVLDTARHHYQEIPAVTSDNSNHLPNSEARAHDSAIGGESDTDTPHQLHFESLYDLPDQLASPSPVPGSSPHQDSTNPSKPAAPPHHQDGSHSHEQPDTLRGEAVDVRSSMGDSSDFTNNDIQVTPPPEESVITSCLAGSSSGDTVALELDVEPHVEFVVVNPSGEGGSFGTLPLPDIPENPYHVLEEGNETSTTQGDRNETKYVRETSGGVVSPQILHHRLSLSEDEGYDRLVGPPHIYHILQNSPSLVRPCIRECSPTSGYHHLDNRMEPRGHTLKDGEHLRALFMDDTLDSLMVSDSELFDDPQYNCSPKRTVNGGPVKSHRKSHSGQTTALERGKVNGAVDLSKYRGDYERDPMYMKLVQKLTEPAGEDSDHVDVSLLMKDVARSDKSASLPDITHTYQSLQTLTRDPLRNYEMLHKRQLTVNSENV